MSRFPTKGRFWCWGLIRRLGLQLLGISTYIRRSIGEGPATPCHPWPQPLVGRRPSPLSPNPSYLSSTYNSRIRLCVAVPEFSITTATTPSCCRDSRRIYYFCCPLERGGGHRRHQHRTCDRVRRCCPIVAPSRFSMRFCKRQVIVYHSNKSLILDRKSVV